MNLDFDLFVVMSLKCSAADAQYVYLFYVKFTLNSPQHSIMHRYVSEQSIMSLAISSGKGMKIDYVIGLVSLSEIIYYNSSLH